MMNVDEVRFIWNNFKVMTILVSAPKLNNKQ